MRKLTLLFATLLLAGTSLRAQGYDIRINLKGCKDTMVFLVKYTFDQQYISDTAKNVKNGQIVFKGKKDLDKGVYTVVSQEKTVYFDFFINECQNMTMTSEVSDIMGQIKAPNCKENEQFFSYIRYITGKNQDFNKTREKTKGMSKEDSTKFMNEKIKQLNDEVKKYEVDFMAKVKGSYLYDVLNLKTEKEWGKVPKNKADTIEQYYYYKNHFFDGIDFKDDRIARTPFFDDRVKKYFESVILMHPDTVIAEIDKVMAKTGDCNLIYKLLLGHFTYKYEQSKIMGFDKVFVHLCDRYITSGGACGVYDAETIKKIKDRADIMRNLLLDAKVKELYVIDTADGRKVRKMGFDTATTSKSITDLYYKNINTLTPMFKTLYGVNAKYTVLVFWAVDCGHCQTEIPKLKEELDKLKGKIDFKVFAVQTKDDLYDNWRKFIVEKKLTDFLHYYDPIHLNNLKENFDIYSTPVIYILDKDKRIKAKRLGAEQVAEMLKTLENIEKEQKKQQ